MPWILFAVLLAVVPGATWAVKWQGSRRARLRAASAWRAWLPDLVALAFLALTALGFFWRVVTGQSWMPADGGDLVSFLFPTYRFAAAALHAGAWPLWDPHLYVGAPHVADIQAGFLYPPNLLLFLLDPAFPYQALQWLSIGHIWFAGAGMYFFLSRGRAGVVGEKHLGRLPALAGALAFMFSDALLVHFGNLNFNAVVSWMPWVFWAYLAGLDSLPARFDPRRFGRGALAGLLLALGSLAGHIQATLFIALALTFYTLAWLYLHREAPEPAGRTAAALGYLALTGAVMALVAAPMLLPALQLASFTARASWNYQEAAGYSIAPAQWIGLLIPGFFGRTPQFHWGPWPRVEVGYLGILPLILAVVALALRRDRGTWSWLALACGSYVVALGTYATPHGWLTLLPGFGQLRAPARLVFVTDFGLATLAAIGLDAALAPFTPESAAAFARIARGIGYGLAGVMGVGVPLTYLALLLSQGSDAASQAHIWVASISVLIFAGLLLASLFWLLARRGGWARPVTLGWLALALIVLDTGSTGAYQDLGDQDPSSGFAQPAIAAFLAAQPGPFRIDTRTDIQDHWQPDTALLYGFDDVAGLANPVMLADVQRYWEGLDVGGRSSSLYDLLNVRYIVAHKNVVLDWQKFRLVFDGSPDLNVYQNRLAMPRAFLVSGWQAVASHEAAWQAIHAAGFDPRTTAVVEGTEPSGPGLPPGGAGRVTVVAAPANGLSLQAMAKGPALLVLSQVWYPGWQVWVDGAPHGQPLRVDYLFQGVALSAGSHRIELRFQPPLWRIGWIVAGVALLGLLAWLGVAKLWRASDAD
jgi:hypothetical protein